MDAITVIIVTVMCGIISAFLYKKRLQFGIVREDKFSKHIHCVTIGDMYCSHLDWCSAEIALHPDQYEAETKRLENE